MKLVDYFLKIYYNMNKERIELMKYYLDDKEITLEKLEEVRKNLVCADAAEEVIELLKIEPDAMYFTITLYQGV